MGRRFEATDSSGDTVWAQDGFEVYRDGEKFKVRDSVRGLRAWLPGRYDSVDQALIAAIVRKQIEDGTEEDVEQP